MNDAAQVVHGWRWAPAWVLAFVALWPAPGYAEGVLALGALAGLIKLVASRFRGGNQLLGGPAWALTSVLFFAYWLPEAFSAIDAMDRGRALREALVDLRYLPFLWIVAAAVAASTSASSVHTPMMIASPPNVRRRPASSATAAATIHRKGR